MPFESENAMMLLVMFADAFSPIPDPSYWPLPGSLNEKVNAMVLFLIVAMACVSQVELMLMAQFTALTIRLFSTVEPAAVTMPSLPGLTMTQLRMVAGS